MWKFWQSRRKHTITIDNYRITFDAAAKEVFSELGIENIPEFLKNAVAVRVDLSDAEENRELSIILRDKSGKEWSYSPKTPGKATLLRDPPDGGGGGEPSLPPNVIRLTSAVGKRRFG